MAGIEGGGAHASPASAGRPNDDAIADTARALLVALCAGFAARVPAEHFAEIKSELDAVRAALEDATNRIIDAGAEIDSVAEGVDESARDRLAASTAAIYEAMGFQDLTGQRMSKVEDVLDDIQASLTGGVPAADAGNAASREDADLLHGPQLPEEAMGQDDIDAILAGNG